MSEKSYTRITIHVKYLLYHTIIILKKYFYLRFVRSFIIFCGYFHILQLSLLVIIVEKNQRISFYSLNSLIYLKSTMKHNLYDIANLRSKNGIGYSI